jgi:hypothetical protein
MNQSTDYIHVAIVFTGIVCIAVHLAMHTWRIAHQWCVEREIESYYIMHREQIAADNVAREKYLEFQFSLPARIREASLVSITPGKFAMVFSGQASFYPRPAGKSATSR